MPNSPGGDRNQLAVAIMFWLCKFRYLTPREGTKTLCKRQRYRLLHVQTPYSPWGDGNAMSHLRYDTTNLFRCPTPREGTKTFSVACAYLLSDWCSDTLIPREGTKTYMDGVHHLVFRRSDTLLPGRGRKRIHFIIPLSMGWLFRYLSPREGTET